MLSLIDWCGIQHMASPTCTNYMVCATTIDSKLSMMMVFLERLRRKGIWVGHGDRKIGTHFGIFPPYPALLCYQWMTKTPV